ncbi:MAG: methyltransferase domain-containing protein [Planctomycetes bacterium]|nr:methyltransferase domain-containing protein [Planctomycetota bacterium]
MGEPCELCGCAEPPRTRFPSVGIVECGSCGLVYYPGGVDARATYTLDYFHGREYQDYPAEKPWIQRNFRARIRDLRALRPGGRLLEIGCAYGFFLELARRHWQVSGLDISRECVEHARGVLGLDVESADFLDLPDEPESRDVICLWDTIEHLARPVRVLEKAARWLRPGGVLALTTGDVESAVARWRGERWRLIHPPTHLFYFSRRTLGQALTGAGLRVDRVRYVGYTRSLKAMLYGMLVLRSPEREWAYRGLTLGGRLDLPVPLNLFDIMMATAVKPLHS